MNELRARWIALTALTALALYLCWRLILPFIDVLVWSIVLVVVVYPLHRWIDKRTRRPGLSAIISIVFMILCVLIPLSFLTAAVVGELADLASETQAYARKAMADPEKSEKVRALIDVARRYVDVDQLLSPDSLKDLASKASNIAVKGTMSIVGGVVGLVAKIALVLFTSFYLLRDARVMLSRVVVMLPLDRGDAETIIRHTGDIFLASVYGVLTIGVAQGALGGVMFWLLGLPSALVWGTVMAIFSIVPVVGSGLIWAPAAAFLALTGHWAKAVVLASWGLVVIGSADNLIRPRLVGSRTHMHDLIVFFAVLGGLQVFGILGILLGPVIVAVTAALLDVFRLGEKQKVRLVGE